MNPKYFKDKIYTELNASCDYMKKAIDSMKSHPKWSYIFKVMSDERYAHAEQLYRMFMELYLDSNDQETYLNSIRDAIIETLTSQTRLIDGYRATYDLINSSSESEETNDGNSNND
jgi:Fic family protein